MESPALQQGEICCQIDCRPSNRSAEYQTNVTWKDFHQSFPVFLKQTGFVNHMTVKIFFLHGLESSSKGTKARYFANNFPAVVCKDFSGDLKERLRQLDKICTDAGNITFIGSSFGGLMATCFTLEHPDKVASLILLAPALNYGDYRPPKTKLPLPVTLIVGRYDTVTPADKVIPLAKETFSNLEVQLVNDDHMLHNSFPQLNWKSYLEEQHG